MERMCAQTRPWFVLSSEIVVRSGIRACVNSKEKLPQLDGSEEGGTCNAASHRISSPVHYQGSPWIAGEEGGLTPYLKF